MVLSMARLRSVRVFVSVPGWLNSFMAPTIRVTRCTPSRVWAMALGISSMRNSRSASSAIFRTAAASPGAAIPASWRSRRACCAATSCPSAVNASRRKMVLSPMYWVGVLISWAMPAASWPMDSSFWAWRIWTSLRSCSASAFFRAVTSLATRITCGSPLWVSRILAPLDSTTR